MKEENGWPFVDKSPDPRKLGTTSSLCKCSAKGAKRDDKLGHDLPFSLRPPVTSTTNDVDDGENDDNKDNQSNPRPLETQKQRCGRHTLVSAQSTVQPITNATTRTCRTVEAEATTTKAADTAVAVVDIQTTTIAKEEEEVHQTIHTRGDQQREVQWGRSTC